MIYLFITMATKGYSQEYSFTITLKGRARELSTEDQYKLYSDWIIDYIKSRGTAQYGYHPQARIPHRNIMITMVCELHQTGDIHFHGVITYPMEMNIKDHMMFFHQMFKLCNIKKKVKNYQVIIDKKDPLMSIGRLDIKPVTDSKGWYEYLAKTFKDFKYITGKKPIIVDEHCIFGTEDILNYHK